MPLKGESETKRYDLKGGIHPGAIAGLLGGVMVPITYFVGVAVGFWPPAIPHPDISFWLSQLGAHVLFNLIWGIVFGILFVRPYEIIPGKRMLKGIVYGLVIFLITSFRWAIHYLAYGDILDFQVWVTTGFLNFLVFGLVLGILYRKPND